MYHRKESMKKLKTEFEEINLHGYKIHIYSDKIKIYNHDNIPMYDFKSVSDGLTTYLMDEAFIERKKIRVEVATIKPKEESNNDNQIS
jgi:hypothetical protein